MAWEVVKSPSAQWFDLPIIGDDLANVGRIISMWSEPCSPQATIWVYGLFQALPTLFITLTKPELIDIDIHKGHHRPRKGKRFRTKPSAIFRDSLITVPVPNWRVFRIYEWGQRIGWYFLVADATEEFAINWISTAYMWSGCPGTAAPYGIKVAESSSLGSSPTPIKVAWFAGGPSHQMTPTPWGYKINVPGNYSVSWDVNFTRRVGGNPPYGPDTVWLMYEEPGSPPTPITPLETTLGKGNSQSSSGQSQVVTTEVGGEFYLMWQSSVAKVFYMSGTLSISGVENEATRPDP